MADKKVSQLPQIGGVGAQSLFVVEHNGIAYHATAPQITEDLRQQHTQLENTVNGISFTVSDPINGGTNNYVTLTLMVDGKPQRYDLMLNGNVDISGQLSAQALYTTLGDIANLKVDALSTSRRIPKYLAEDTSDDNYIDIEGQNIVLRRAWTDGSTEQARDPYGALLYWASDITGASLGADGYPYVNGQRVFITTEETPYPVYVYKYQSGDRLKIFFDEDNNYGPRMVWGEGYGNANKEQGRGYIQKLGNSFDMYLHGSDNVKRGIFIGDDAVDIVGERMPTKMAWSGNTLNVTYQGGKTRAFVFSDDLKTLTVDGHTIQLEGFA